jgi:hypothetical protein
MRSLKLDITLSAIIALMTSGVLFHRIANAGTVYRDRPYPVPITSQVCMVKFAGYNLNANVITEVSVGKRDNGEDHVDNPKWGFLEPEKVWVKRPTIMSLRVTLATGVQYQITEGNLEKQEADFLDSIRRTCK